MGITGLMKDFSGWTSAHGIPQIGAARTMCLRISWVVIFFGSLAMFIYQLTVIINNYLKYGVTVSTIFGNLSLALQYPYTTEPHGDWNFISTLNQSLGAEEKARLNLIYITGSLSEADKIAMTYSLSDLIIECGYESRACDMENDFKKIYDPFYGACYQFNNGQEIKTNTRSGREWGLSLLIKNEQEELLPTSEEAAAKITVHTHNLMAFPEAFGYNAPVGSTMDIAIKMTKTERLSEPYGDCTEGMGTEKFYYDADFSMEACMRSCAQKLIIADCGCADPRYILPPGSTYCTIADDSCLEKYRTGPKLDGSYSKKFLKDCSCTQACKDVLYGGVSSVKIWPADNHMPQECAKQLSENETAAEICRQWYQLNTVKVFVYYERMTYRTLIEAPAYTITDIILNLGGQLGLWVGYSAITVVEFFSLLILIILFCCAKKKGPQAGPTEPDPDDDEMEDIERILREKHGIETDSSDGDDGDDNGDDDYVVPDDDDDVDDKSPTSVDPYAVPTGELTPPPVMHPLA